MGVDTAGSPRVVIVPPAPTEATVLVAPRVITSAVVTLVVGDMAAVVAATKFSTAQRCLISSVGSTATLLLKSTSFEQPRETGLDFSNAGTLMPISIMLEELRHAGLLSFLVGHTQVDAPEHLSQDARTAGEFGGPLLEK